MEASEPGRSLEKRAEEVVESAIVGLATDFLKWGLVAGATAIGLAAWRGGSIPVWVALVATLAVIVLALLRGRRMRRRITAINTEATTLDFALLRHENYTSHVAEVLDNLQRVVAGDLHASMADYIVRGILEPAREYLTGHPDDNVRLAILTTREDDPSRWQMVLTAGHSLTGSEKYRERIVDTMSRFAFETGTPQSWNDVTVDRTFTPTPAATRPFRSMISLPIRNGDAIIGVFNVISAEPDAFDPAEERYVASLGGVVNVAVSIWLMERLQDHDDSDESEDADHSDESGESGESDRSE